MFPASTYDHSQHLSISRQPGNSNPVKVPVFRFLRKFLTGSAAFHPVICASPKTTKPSSSLADGILQEAQHRGATTHDTHSHETRVSCGLFSGA